MKKFDDIDLKYMKLALGLAANGRGRVSPNPMVGCVIVKNKKIIGSGYHGIFGGPHAEINALKSCKNAAGATMYVNLEPCCHYNKKTSPCVPEIIKSGIKNIVIAMKDPNREVNGRGIKQLKFKGVRCKVGVLKKEAEQLNEVYVKYITKKMPFVILKMAYSLDGKTSSVTGDSKWISSEESRRRVHDLRSEVDAVLVGINTVIRDNPLLTSHGRGKNPARIILDADLKIPLSSNVLNKEAKTVIATSKDSPINKIGKLEKKGIKVLKIPSSKGKINLKKLLASLANMGVSSLLAEGGPTVAESFINNEFVDKIMFFICPKIINGFSKMGDAIAVKNVIINKSGSDVIFEGYPDV